jgi:hypothetical protein
MRSSGLWACVASALLCFPSTFRQLSQPVDSNQSVWFILSNGQWGAHWIDPVVLVANKKLIEAPAYCGDMPAEDEFGKIYLRPGRTYAVGFGGARAGEISLKAPKPNESILGAVDYRGAAPIDDRVSALATNANIDSTRQNARQAPTPADVVAALELAKALFAKAGVPTGLLSKVKQDDLTRSTLLPDRTASLIGSFFLPKGGDLDPSHALFFVAKQSGGKLAAEYTLIRIAKSPTESETIHFVDQADLFGDGQDEIIAINGYYENYRYRIFGRSADGKNWTQIFETGILGCE